MFHRIAVWRVFVTLDFSTFSTSGNGRGSSAEADRIGFVIGRGEPTWSILPGWTVDGGNADLRHGAKRLCHSRKAKVPSTPADIAAELAQLPTCRRIVFETGRMAPMLYH